MCSSCLHERVGISVCARVGEWCLSACTYCRGTCECVHVAVSKPVSLRSCLWVRSVCVCLHSLCVCGMTLSVPGNLRVCVHVASCTPACRLCACM